MPTSEFILGKRTHSALDMGDAQARRDPVADMPDFFGAFLKTALLLMGVAAFITWLMIVHDIRIMVVDRFVGNTKEMHFKSMALFCESRHPTDGLNFITSVCNSTVVP